MPGLRGTRGGVLIVDTYISLCSGIGGLDLGFSAGLRVVGGSPRAVCYVEREAFCVSCLGKAIEDGRLDEAPIYCGDLQTIPLDLFPRIDYIVGGYPCQPFSSAGDRKGSEDQRHLWPHVFQYVDALRPKGVFFENVAGHISLGLFDVLSDLEKIGYRTAWGCYSASSVGAPHRRERVFILGMADADGGGLEKLSKRDSESSARREIQQGDNADGCDSGWCDRSECCVEGCECDMAHAECPRRSYGISEAAKWERPKESGDGNQRHGGEQNGMADARPRYRPTPHRWPAPPGVPQPDEETPRTTKPGLGGNAHGLPDRVDRLRALGNAVVPQQAEMAFIDLWQELHQ